MRLPSVAIIVATLLPLAACATSPDPAHGGFFSGVHGLISGGYSQRVADQADELQQMRMQQAAAEAQSSQTTAALAARERQLANLRNDVARLDLSVKEAQAKIDQQQMHTVALSDKNRRLMNDLEAAEGRVTSLQQQLSPNISSDEYEAARRKYLDLQAAIETLTDQIQGKQL